MTQDHPAPRERLSTPAHAPGAAAQAQLARDHQLLIDGEWREARTGRRIDVVDPASGRRIATVAEAGDTDIADAVRAARPAHDSRVWSGLSGERRAQITEGAVDAYADEADCAQIRPEAHALAKAQSEQRREGGRVGQELLRDEHLECVRPRHELFSAQALGIEECEELVERCRLGTDGHAARRRRALAVRRMGNRVRSGERNWGERWQTGMSVFATLLAVWTR